MNWTTLFVFSISAWVNLRYLWKGRMNNLLKLLLLTWVRFQCPFWHLKSKNKIQKLCLTESQMVSQTAKCLNVYILNKIISAYWTRNTGRFAPSCSECMARTFLFCLAAHQSDRPSEWSDPTGEPGSASWVAQISCYSYKHWLMFRVGQQQHWEFYKERKKPQKNKGTCPEDMCHTWIIHTCAIADKFNYIN